MAARGWQSRGTRMIAGAAFVALAAALPVAAQSPSATPYDVSLFKWSVADEADGFDQGLLHDLVVGADGRVLLLGGDRAGDTVSPVVWGSDDGRTWARLEGDLPPDSIASDGVEADDGFMVITALGDGGEGRLYRSDGMSLAPLEAPTEALIAIERSPSGLHLLDGSSPTVWTSTDDGANWTSAIVPGDDALASHLAVTEAGTLVVVGTVEDDGRRVPTAWSSTDGGVTWRSTTLPIDAGSWVVGDLAWTPIGLIVRLIDAPGRDGSHVNLLSTDGTTWAPTIETTGSGSVGSAGPEAIIFGEDAAWHSADGVTWTEEWWPTLAGFDVVASQPMPSGPVVAAGVRRDAPATGAIFVGAPAPQPVPSAPIDLVSPAP